MAFEIKELSGSLFEQEDKRSDKSPDFTGNCKIDGKEYRVAGWWTESRGGKVYISLKFSDPEDFKPKQPVGNNSSFEQKRAEIKKRAEEFKRKAAGDFDKGHNDDIPF